MRTAMLLMVLLIVAMAIVSNVMAKEEELNNTSSFGL